jgi:hypothetical protein
MAMVAMDDWLRQKIKLSPAHTSRRIILAGESNCSKKKGANAPPLIDIS